MPLRASSFNRQELPVIIFVTDLEYIKNEWDMISTFPDIYILNVSWKRNSLLLSNISFVQGSPSNPYNLQLICIQDCRQCVIISTLDRENPDTYLVDKSSVLNTLNIRQIEMKSAGFVSALNLTGQGLPSDIFQNQATFLLQNRIRTLTTLSEKKNFQHTRQWDIFSQNYFSSFSNRLERSIRRTRFDRKKKKEFFMRIDRRSFFSIFRRHRRSWTRVLFNNTLRFRFIPKISIKNESFFSLWKGAAFADSVLDCILSCVSIFS